MVKHPKQIIDAKKPRGRLPKQFIGAKKPRGRPPKQFIGAKKPRGRPPKQIIDAKKPRGRPPKQFINVEKISNNKCFANNQNKFLVNIKFIGYIASAKLKYNCDNSFVGALDSIENNTSKLLLSIGINKKNILLVESNNKVSLSHIKQKFPTYKGTLEEFSNNICSSKTLDNNKCLGWYFDTCGMIHTQKNGIFNVIKKSNLIDGSVLAFTFTRTRVKKFDYDEQKKEFIKNINMLISSKGFTFKKIFDYDYSGAIIGKRAKESHMNSFIYIIDTVN